MSSCEPSKDHRLLTPRDLEQALQVKGRFLAMMSHGTLFLTKSLIFKEIRTPLAGVMGTMSLLADTNLPPESKEMVRTALICGGTSYFIRGA